jgi:hypothetical protein
MEDIPTKVHTSHRPILKRRSRLAICIDGSPSTPLRTIGVAQEPPKRTPQSHTISTTNGAHPTAYKTQGRLMPCTTGVDKPAASRPHRSPNVPPEGPKNRVPICHPPPRPGPNTSLRPHGPALLGKDNNSPFSYRFRHSLEGEAALVFSTPITCSPRTLYAHSSEHTVLDPRIPSLYDLYQPARLTSPHNTSPCFPSSVAAAFMSAPCTPLSRCERPRLGKPHAHPHTRVICGHRQCPHIRHMLMCTGNSIADTIT